LQIARSKSVQQNNSTTTTARLRTRPYRFGDFQRDGQITFYNQGARANFLSSIQPISTRQRSVELNKVHNNFQGDAITFLSEIRPEDFNAPRKLWEKVFDDGAKERFISNISSTSSKTALL
jgi:catalase